MKQKILALLLALTLLLALPACGKKQEAPEAEDCSCGAGAPQAVSRVAAKTMQSTGFQCFMQCSFSIV